MMTSKMNPDIFFDESRFVGALTDRPVPPPDVPTDAPPDVPTVPPVPDDGGRLRAERDAASARAALLQEELDACRIGQNPDADAFGMEQRWLEFIQDHPDIRDPAHDLSPAVWDAIRTGKSPCSAWLEDRNRLLESRISDLSEALESLSQSRRAAVKSPGSAVSSAIPMSPLDPFLEGLSSGF